MLVIKEIERQSKLIQSKDTAIDSLRNELAALQKTYGINDHHKLSESQQPTGHRTGAQGAQKWILKLEEKPQKLTTNNAQKELIPVYKMSEEDDCHART